MERENLAGDAKGKGASGDPARPKVPMHRPGADDFVVGLNLAKAYTESADRGTFAAEDLSALPATVQPWIDDKVDVRVTVVSNEVFAVEVRGPDAGPIRGDWRKIKDGSLRYTPVVLPSDVVRSCLQLTTSLGLCFGAIDLLRIGDRFLFLEINPTGEWAWLVETANLPIDHAMVKLLLSEHA
jgi:glutathione synthase/RimK-type ligase-like ATP-grasp enzyme